MPRLAVSRLAEEDLLAIWLYVAKGSVDSADTLLDRFTDEFRRIAEHPALGELVQAGRRDVRRSLVLPYLVFYESMVDEVLIVRVLHGSRRWDELI